jgi:hypothetical protein
LLLIGLLPFEPIFTALITSLAGWFRSPWVIKTGSRSEIKKLIQVRYNQLDKIGAMGSLVFAVVPYIRAFFVQRHKLALETAALRQQLAVFKR